MSSPSWTILTDRLGRDVRTPSEDQIDYAIHDLRDNRHDAEHPCVALRHGIDEGPMKVIEVFRDGSVSYTEYADTEFETEVRKLNAESLGVLDIERRLFYVMQDDADAIDLCVWHTKK